MEEESAFPSELPHQPLGVTCRKAAFRGLLRPLSELAAGSAAAAVQFKDGTEALVTRGALEHRAAVPEAAPQLVSSSSPPTSQPSEVEQADEENARQWEWMVQMLDMHLNQATKLATALSSLVPQNDACQPVSERHYHAVQRVAGVYKEEKQLRQQLQQLQQYQQQLQRQHHGDAIKRQGAKQRAKGAVAAAKAGQKVNALHPSGVRKTKGASPSKDVVPPHGKDDALWQAVQQLGLDPAQLLAAQSQAQAQALAHAPGLGLGLGLGLGMGLGSGLMREPQQGQLQPLPIHHLQACSPPQQGGLMQQYALLTAQRQAPPPPPQQQQHKAPGGAAFGRVLVPSAFQAHALLRQDSSVSSHGDSDSAASDVCDLEDGLLDPEEDRATWSSGRTTEGGAEPGPGSRRVSAGCQLPKAKTAPVADVPEAPQPQRAASTEAASMRRSHRRRYTEGPETLRFGPLAAPTAAGGGSGSGGQHTGQGGLPTRNSDGVAVMHARLPALREQESAYAPGVDPAALAALSPTPFVLPAQGAASLQRRGSDNGALAAVAGPMLPPLPPRRRSGQLPHLTSPFLSPAKTPTQPQHASSPPQPPLQAPASSHASRLPGQNRLLVPQNPHAPQRHLLHEASDGSEELDEDGCLVLEPEPSPSTREVLAELARQLPSSRFEFPPSSATRTASAPLAQGARQYASGSVGGADMTAPANVGHGHGSASHHNKAASADDAQLSSFDLPPRHSRLGASAAVAAGACASPADLAAAAASVALSKAALMAVRRHSHGTLRVQSAESGGQSEAPKRPSSLHGSPGGGLGVGLGQVGLGAGSRTGALHRVIDSPVEEQSEEGSAAASPAASPAAAAQATTAAAAAAAVVAEPEPVAETGVGAFKKRMLAALAGRWA